MLNEVYSTSSDGSVNGSAISVSSEYTNGTQVNGMCVELLQNGAAIASGVTQIVFSIAGQTCDVVPSDYTSAYFNEWTDGVVYTSVYTIQLGNICH